MKNRKICLNKQQNGQVLKDFNKNITAMFLCSDYGIFLSFLLYIHFFLAYKDMFIKPSWFFG